MEKEETQLDIISRLLPVSYTHLDVYKRQVPTMIKKENKPLIYIYNTHQTEEYTPSSLVAVSYTHLDVYKRQVN